MAGKVDSMRLMHLAASHGFLNPFSHRALFDVMTMLKIMSEYSFEEVLLQSKVPFVIARALVDYDNRQLAKDARFNWEKIGEETFPKQWVKQVRENKLAAEQAAAEAKGFKVVRIR
jgi:hypothetical protein